jgi:phosphoglycolate phosphatase-like HAD superfamily hydrolase
MLIFDFDGVLIKSLDEVVVTSYNAVTGKLVTFLTEVPPDAVKMFRNNRFHIQPIGDAVALMDWCLKNQQKDAHKILSAQEYRSIANRAEPGLGDRTNLIYDTRKRFIDRDTDRWLALHQPYQPLWNELLHQINLPFVILTHKNHDATLRLCRHFGLNIDANDIYSGDQGVSKIENMLRIKERFSKASFSFIDDSVKNLKELDFYFNTDKQILELSLAVWGYIGAEDVGTARELGYPALQQTDVILLLGNEVRGFAL